MDGKAMIASIELELVSLAISAALRLFA